MKHPRHPASGNHPTITRRQSFRLLAAASIGAGVSQQLAAQDSKVEKPLAAAAFPKPTLHVYPDYGWLRGFSVVPSWGARIEEAWWFYDGARMREEVALAR